MTVSEAVLEYGVEHAAMGRKTKTWESFGRDVNRFFGAGTELGKAMKPALVVQYVANLRQRGNVNQTVVNKLAFLKSLCRLSTEAEQPVAFPRRLVGAIKVDNQRERVLSEEEKEALRQALPCTEDWGVIDFAMSTGLRSAELFGLEVADCDFELNEQNEVTVQITVRAELTRTKKARRFPVVGWARDYCLKAREAGRRYVVKLFWKENRHKSYKSFNPTLKQHETMSPPPEGWTREQLELRARPGMAGLIPEITRAPAKV